MKAKLEIEMPEGCYDCQFCAGTECGAVEGMPTIDLFGEEGLRPKWCPLIPEEIMDGKLLNGKRQRMKCNRLRKDDPVFYKCAITDLLREAKENGLIISLAQRDIVTTLYFENDVGEKAGVIVFGKEM